MSLIAYSCSIENHPDPEMEGAKSLALGGGVIKRKLDRAYVPQLWKRLRIGVRMNFDPVWLPPRTDIYPFVAALSPTTRNDQCFFIGLCSSSGSAPFEGGYVSHSLGVVFDDNSTLMYRTSSITTGESMFYTEGFIPLLITQSTLFNLGGNINPCYSLTSTSSRYYLLEYIRSTLTPTSSISITGTFINYGRVNTDATSSARLVSALKDIRDFTSAGTTTWSILSEGAISYENTAAVGSIPCNEIINGELDTVAIAWQNTFSKLWVSEVLIQYSLT